MILATERKSDDMNVVAPDRNEKSTSSGGNSSLIGDHCSCIVNNWLSVRVYGKIIWGWWKL